MTFALLVVLAQTMLDARPAVAAPSDRRGASERSDESHDFFSDAPDWVVDVIGGKPWGTHIERLRHMSFAYVVQSPPGVSEALTGFRFSERGSALIQLIAIATTSAAAQAEANRTQSTVTYEVPIDRKGTFGLSLEYATSPTDDVGSERAPFSFAIGLDNISYLGSDEIDASVDNLPITLRWGLIGKFWKARDVAPDPDHPPDPERFTDGGYLGISLDFAFPLTRWAQINTELNIGYPDIEIILSGTAHLGNRFFVKAGSNTTWRSLGYFGAFLNMGVRL